MVFMIQKWRQLSGRDRCLFFQAFWGTGLIRCAVLFFPFWWIALFLGEEGTESPDKLKVGEREKAFRIGRAIQKVSRYTPWESKCLVQAVTGKLLLRRAKIDSTLYLGVKKSEQGKMTDHAWLRAGEIIVTGAQGEEGYTRISCFGERKGVNK